ncbi:MAG: UPF0489 family protein [Candidatus Peribacteria bacterium]|jgi:hypothetical protein|nr:UPF0489 family protein [Candidatus Peribacteria bacterium]
MLPNFTPYSGFFLPLPDENLHFELCSQPLRVAPLVAVATFSQAVDKLNIDTEHFAFTEQNEKGEPTFFHGLQQFLHIQTPRCYLFDNHHHALFFRYQEYLRSRTICKVLHIDQHSDMRDNQFSLPDDLLKVDRSREVFAFVQQHCNVGNFIQPAVKAGLISDVVQIRTETALQQEAQHPKVPFPYILDLDLDFFAPEMDINFLRYLPPLQQLIQNAECTTIATSPYFLQQEKALEMMKEILSLFF